ncbi:bifunctional folylpolyglutamate synthase/dihydrofolate synthase [Petrocella sp. FN5]|uniref:bifunctional folylpolyglutamate synthase/dihydrofolate synthase n=1 Tax=Petrocella sp. FN5 TaxID=3032002 RepID=UPI0023DB1F8D|nr:Mur ligase family protein [Petrocella sp. FN5]MDF1616672.1 Mur ligase family protein [Petrocella sp. FN5]
MTFEDIVDEIVKTPRFRKQPEFIVIKTLIQKIGYMNNIPVVHVAGTNGKGSVVMMMASIFESAGYKVGTFTSPHLVDIRERICINHQMMSKEAFIEIYGVLNKFMKEMALEGYEEASFFEIILAMALMYFKKEKPDILLLEAGIGGRLDTTNALENKILTIITNISMDHTQILGETLEKIAFEKSGIMRLNTPIVFYNSTKEVNDIIKKVAKEKQAPYFEVLPFDAKIIKRNQESIDFSLRNKYYEYETLHMNTSGDYQIENVKIAITAIHILQQHFNLSKEHIKEGIGNFKWLGRMTYITPSILLEGAHNKEGIEAFVKHIGTNEGHKAIDLVFICMNDKQDDEMIEALCNIKRLRSVYIPRNKYIKAQNEARLMERFKQYGFDHVYPIEELKDFILRRKDNKGDQLLCCVGSLYLVGDIIKIIEEG